MARALAEAIARLREQLGERGLASHADQVERVLRASAKAHEGQTRKNGDPYVTHPIRVAEVVLVEWDRREPAWIMAALLHDSVEDTPLTLALVESLAGKQVRELVDFLTKPDPAPAGSKEERDRCYFARLAESGPEGALAVKCADRIDNLRDMQVSGWTLEKKRSYLKEARESIVPPALVRAPYAAQALERVIESISAALG